MRVKPRTVKSSVVDVYKSVYQKISHISKTLHLYYVIPVFFEIILNYELMNVPHNWKVGGDALFTTSKAHISPIV